MKVIMDDFSNIFIKIIILLLCIISTAVGLVSVYFIQIPIYEEISKINLNKQIESLSQDSFCVTLTTYNATLQQTDASPFETSCGLKINQGNPQKQRFVALSRDLLNYFCYGDSIEISNCGKFNGKYVVADCTAKRLNNVVDVLINRNTVGGKFNKAILKKVY